MDPIIANGANRMKNAKGSVAQAIRTLIEELQSANESLLEERLGSDL